MRKYVPNATLYPILAAGALLAATPFASAAPNASAPAVHAHAGAENGTGAQAAASEQALQSAKVPLTQAIGTAEQHTNGKAFYARFEMYRGKPYYQIRTFQNDQEWAGLVDADSGQVVGKGKTFPQSQLSAKHKDEIQALQNAQTSLTDAVQNAEQDNQGAKVVEAALATNRNGKTAYDVHLVQSGKERVAMINPSNGQLE